MPLQPIATLRLGARGSLLSRLQSTLVSDQLRAKHPHLRINHITITTSGDSIQDRPLHEFGGKGLFTKELEQALLRDEIDFAVHSYKDLPVTMPLVDTANLIIAATPQREDPRDLLVSKVAHSIDELPRAARVGTSSFRRQAQLQDLRPDLQILPLRGNVDTRIRKLLAGDFDAIILAFAGVKRAGLLDPAIMTPLEITEMLPAAGQAALALQCRRDAPQIRDLLATLNDSDTATSVELERRIVHELNGDCHSPIAALATLENHQLTLRAAVAHRNGHPPLIHADITVDRAESDLAVASIIGRLLSHGAKEMLAG